MDECINVEKEKQAHQKPPRSLGRILFEILVGTATASTSAAIVYSFFYVVGQMTKDADVIEGSMCSITLWDLVILGIMIWVVPATYVLGSTVGVYFVGRIGNQTGSFLATLGGSLLGMIVMALPYFYIKMAENYMMLGVEKIVLWPLVFLAAPSMATLGFNLTRRYKQPPSS